MKSKFQTILLVLFLLSAAAVPGRGVLAAANSTGFQKSADLHLLNLSSAARTGWQYINGNWYYFDEGGNKKTGWQYIDGNWYYMSSRGGVMLTGWQKLDGSWYYLASSGAMAVGWQYLGGNWYYLTSSGAMATGWQYIGGKWYYLSPNGDMITGWRHIGGKWYYLSKPDGGMLTGWQKLDSKWYYFAPSGDMKTGWQYLGSKWYYLNPDGDMAAGWLHDGGKWYYLSEDNGSMLTGFQVLGRKLYYFKASGEMAAGWHYLGGSWYYFSPDGDAAQDCWKYINGNWYVFNSRGIMLTGWQTIGGRQYYLNPSGDMANGFQIISGKACCFGSDGALQEDWSSKNVIVIDPGHSSEIPDGRVPVGPGSDKTADADNYGAVSITNGLHEYELVLDVSLKLRDRLEARGYKVVMVRTTNSGTYSCVDRARVANDANAAIFLRVHANQAPKDHSKNGAMTICITDENEFVPQMYKKSRLLSDLILKNYISAVGCYNEGVWERDDLIANNWSKVPTTLIELGYMSNSKEDQLMQTSDYQEKMVNGMVNGIDAYFKATVR